ncbi:DUF378 domain-containing protein, partial [Pediococcus acidilactici]
VYILVGLSALYSLKFLGMLSHRPEDDARYNNR